MADSLLDLGSTTTLFATKPDYADGVGSGLADMGRDLIQGNLGRRQTRLRTTEVPLRVAYRFAMLTKSDEYDLVEFFCARRGMNKRFWLPLWNQAFVLKSAIAKLSYTFEIEDNNFDEVVKYYERIFIYTTTGDMITRKILTRTGNVYTVETAFDRDIALTDVLYFGRLLMARFDQDELEVRHVTNTISEAEVNFVELPKEYETSATGS